MICILDVEASGKFQGLPRLRVTQDQRRGYYNLKLGVQRLRHFAGELPSCIVHLLHPAHPAHATRASTPWPRDHGVAAPPRRGQHVEVPVPVHRRPRPPTCPRRCRPGSPARATSRPPRPRSRTSESIHRVSNDATECKPVYHKTLRSGLGPASGELGPCLKRGGAGKTAKFSCTHGALSVAG